MYETIENIAKAIRHKACDIVMETASENPNMSASDLATVLHSRILNIKTLDAVESVKDYSVVRAVRKTKATIKARDKGIDMASHKIGSWDCESPDGIGVCVLHIDDEDACIFCGEPDERK